MYLFHLVAAVTRFSGQFHEPDEMIGEESNGRMGSNRHKVADSVIGKTLVAASVYGPNASLVSVQALLEIF